VHGAKVAAGVNIGNEVPRDVLVGLRVAPGAGRDPVLPAQVANKVVRGERKPMEDPPPGVALPDAAGAEVPRVAEEVLDQETEVRRREAQPNELADVGLREAKSHAVV
jgi:hypothetical protein